MLRILWLFCIFPSGVVLGQPSTRQIGDGNCDGAAYTRKTLCLPGKDVQQACKNYCMGSNATTVKGQRCRGFSFIENAVITIDFSRCKGKGLGRCDLFYGCTAIVATRNVTDPMKCVAVEGIADACSTTETTEQAAATAKDSFWETLLPNLMTSSGPTVLGWAVFGSIGGGVVLIIIVIIAICVAKKSSTKEERINKMESYSMSMMHVSAN